MSAAALPFGLDPPGIEYARNPYPALARLRDIAPVHYAQERDGWFISERADIAALLRDDRLDITPGSSFVDRSDPFRATVVRRLRGWFASSEALLTDTVPVATKACMAALIEQGEGDLAPMVAHAIPVRVMASLLGVPASDIPALQHTAEGLLLGYDLKWTGRPTASAPASRVLDLYFHSHWRKAPATELMDLLRTTQAEFALPDASMVDTCSKLFSAGTTTTGAAIANILARLLNAGADSDALRPPYQVDDLLRLDTPVLGIKRVARAEVQLGAAVIRPGQSVCLLIGGSNRMPVGAPHAPPLTFGLGRYYCLGAMLARLEIGAVLDAFQPIAPKLRLSGPVRWREAWLLHEARSLPVQLHGVFDAD
ncbi:hypothetical protein [Sphingomonas sp.]|jgi:cytochrome P450|uniref:cytochrome P450 n=1 Tax=Sphingomonas sp. TaxID=28214 RepID=UPI002E139A4E|nr:hypothetical protein [Sphingomonas sp.]